MTEAAGEKGRALRPVEEALELVEVAHFQGVDAWRLHVKNTPPSDGAVMALVQMLRSAFEGEAARLSLTLEEVLHRVRLQAMDAADEAG